MHFFVQQPHVQQELVRCHLHVPDLANLARKLSKRNASLLDCERILVVFQMLGQLLSCLADTDNECVQRSYADEFRKFEEKLRPCAELVESSLEADSLGTGDPILSHRLGEELTKLHRQIVSIKSKATNILSQVAVRLNAEVDKTVKLECDADKGFKFRASIKFEQDIRSLTKEFAIETTKKDGIRFVNNDIKQVADDYVRVRQEYDERQRELVDELMDKVAQYAEPVQALGQLYAHLDVILSFAVAADCGDSAKAFVRPTVLPMGSGRLDLQQLRHPVLERRRDVHFIPNSIRFEGQGKRFFVITGPNMGGKSTFIRSVAICVLMAQAGSFVPAEKAEISIMDGLYTRVGASDQQCKGLSTFMAEMMDASNILAKATANSLVIIDELGRGTSTYDGLGIASSISE